MNSKRAVNIIKSGILDVNRNMPRFVFYIAAIALCVFSFDCIAMEGLEDGALLQIDAPTNIKGKICKEEEKPCKQDVKLVETENAAETAGEHALNKLSVPQMQETFELAEQNMKAQSDSLLADQYFGLTKIEPDETNRLLNFYELKMRFEAERLDTGPTYNTP